MAKPNLVVDIVHLWRKGHWPDWVSFGPGHGLGCVLCVKGGWRQRTPLLVARPRVVA